MDNNPVLNIDPDGSFSRVGAWWRNIVWGGDGITKDKKSGEWGVNYSYINTSGENVMSFIKTGSKPQTLDDLRQEALGQLNDFNNAVEMGAVQLTDGGYIRTVDGKALNASYSLETRAKMLNGMLEPSFMTVSPVTIGKMGVVVKAEEILPKSEPIMRSVGAASRAEMLAKKLGLNANSATTRQVLNSLDDKVSSFISQFRSPTIRAKIPGEFMNMTVEEALRSGNTAVRKLLVDSRFIKK